MSEHTANHPERNLLIDFGLGKLEPTESTWIEEHLAECRECCDTLQNLQDDTFAGMVRSLPEPGEDTEPGKSVQAADTEPGEDAQISGGEAAITDGAVAESDSLAKTLLGSSDASGKPGQLPPELQSHPRYRIVEQIGKGGMGDVYRAEHKLMNRSVALKLINSQLINHPQAVERFRREVQTAAQLNHPNIVTAFDAEQAGNVHFLAMEFVDGTDLASVVEERGPLPVYEACRYIRQAAMGLEHAHELGMVHRDIKPHNLMLGADGQIRILDFGLASFATETAMIEAEAVGEEGETPALHLTTVGSVMGTPDYIAPEQARDAHTADIRADIYSLGCTLCYLLNAEPPFAGASVVDKLVAHVEHDPPELDALRDDVPPELARVVSRMMSKDPAVRYQTPADVAEALEPFLKSSDSESTPAALGSRGAGATAVGRKSSGTRWVIGSIAAAASLVILLGAVIIVATARGRVVIQTMAGDVKVIVKQGGEQIDVIDTKTGSQIAWVPMGDVELELVGNDNAVTLDRTSFQMTRLGTVIVTASVNIEKLATINSFQSTDKTITQAEIEPEGGGWKITANKTRTVRLFETPMPEMKAGPYFYRAKLKTQNVKGRAYLEMWSRFPGRGEFFSRGLNNAISGTKGWAEYQVPFFLKPGEQPDLVKLNVVIEGGGTVWVKDVEVRGRPAMKNGTVPEGTRSGISGSSSEIHLLKKLSGHFRAGINPISLSSDGELLASCGQLGARIWALPAGDLIASLPSQGASLTSVALIPDGKLATTTELDVAKIYLWELPTGRLLGNILTEQTSNLRLAFSPDGKWLAATGVDLVTVWDVATKKTVNQLQLKGYHTSFSFTPDSKSLVIGSTRKMWGIKSGAVTSLLPRGPALTAVRVSSDGNTLAGAVAKSGQILLWDLRNGRQLASFIGHEDRVWSLRFLPGEQLLISGSEDGSIRIWERRTGKEVARREGLQHLANYVLPLPDGRTAVSFGHWFRGTEPAPEKSDWSVHIWRLPESVGPKDTELAMGPDKQESTEQKNQAAMTAAREWLKLVDARKYGDAWEACAEYARNADDKATLINGYTELFEPLGELKSRDWKGSSHTTEMPRAPKGDYVVIQFNTQFNKGRVLETVVLMKEQDEKWRVSGYFHALLKSTLTPAPTVPTGVNLITDASLEETPVGSLPRSWSRYIDTDKEYEYGVVAGGRTGKKSLMLSGEGTRIHAFVNGVPIDRTKRYVLRGWVRYEGDETGSATIKFNYRKGGTNYFIDDGDRVSIGHNDWQFLTKTDRADEAPEADMLWISCKLEGNGKAYFDDLELIAYDRNKLPADFEEKHGKHNQLTGDLDFDRWVGRWEITTRYKPTRQRKDRTVKGEVVVRKLLDGRYLLWEWTSEDGADQYTSLLTLDKYVRGYHFWVFGSDGEAYERIGQWDAAAQTLKLQVKPPVPGVSGVSTDRFVNNDQIESTLLVKNGNGEVSLDMGATWTRKSKTVEEDLKLADRPATDPPELSQLQKMAGNWKVESTLKPSVWEPKGKTETFTQSAAWCSGGRFLLFRAYDKDRKLTSFSLKSWEPKEKVFRFWYFDGKTSGGRWNITWVASSRSFQWRAIDMPDGWVGTASNRWIDDDTFDNQALIKDERGRILMDGQEKMTRIK